MRRELLLLWIVIGGLAVAGIGQTLSSRQRVDALVRALDAERAARAAAVGRVRDDLTVAQGDLQRFGAGQLDVRNATGLLDLRLRRLERWRRFIFP